MEDREGRMVASRIQDSSSSPRQWLSLSCGVSSHDSFCRVILSYQEGSWLAATFQVVSEDRRVWKLPFSPEPRISSRTHCLCLQQILCSQFWGPPAEPSLQTLSFQRAKNRAQGGSKYVSGPTGGKKASPGRGSGEKLVNIPFCYLAGVLSVGVFWHH